jgi:hypothetical protein
LTCVKDPPKHSNAASLSRLRPWEEEKRGSCCKCNNQVTDRHGELQECVRRVRRRVERRMEADRIPKVPVVESPSPSADLRHPTGTTVASGGRESKRNRLMNKKAPKALQAAKWFSDFLVVNQLHDSEIGSIYTADLQQAMCTHMGHRCSKAVP